MLLQFFVEPVSVLLMKLFESHTSRDPTEELVKAAAEGDAQKVEELLGNRELPVWLLFFGEEYLKKTIKKVPFQSKFFL